MRDAELAQNAILLQPGVVNTSVYFVMSGEFVVSLDPTSDGIIAMLNPCDAIGEISFLDHKPPSTYVVATTDATVLICPEALMWHTLRRRPGFALNMLELLPCTTADESMDRLNAVRRHIEQSPFELPDGQSIRCSVSVGVATWQLGQDLNALISLADTALYQAKHDGRNQVSLAPSEGSHLADL
jgi:CRP-like cAMP-binding protein